MGYKERSGAIPVEEFIMTTASIFKSDEITVLYK